MASISRVKERSEEQSSSMSQDQQSAIRMLANDLHRLNQAVMNALFDKMDAADIAAGGQVLNSFFATGRTTGK